MSETLNPYQAPEAALINTPDHVGGSIDNTLAGNADLDVQAVMGEAWDKVSGVKGIVLGASAVILMIATLATGVLGAILGEALTQLVVTVILYPIFAGIFMVGLKQSVGAPVDFGEAFAYFDKLLPIAAVGVLTSIASTLGLLLLVLPGIYLGIALSLSIPLVADKDFGIVEAMTTSLKLIDQKFLSVLVLMLLAGVVMMLGVVTVIGMIWTVPFTVMVYAITYRQLAGASVAD